MGYSIIAERRLATYVMISTRLAVPLPLGEGEKIMCGRARMAVPLAEIAELLRCEPKAWSDEVSNEIRPTDRVATIRLDKYGRRQLELLRWGLIPSWAKDRKIGNQTFNARVETAATKPAFRDAWKTRRCLVVVDAFYEWTGPKTARKPNLVQRADKLPMALAGLWERWVDQTTGEVVDSCTILTRSSEGPLTAIHDRMPIVLPEEVHAAWLDRSNVDLSGLVPLPTVEELIVTPLERI